MPPAKTYEPGMRIDYDPKTKLLTVAFRGRLTALGNFETEREAIRAGEDFCRKHGWIEKPDTGTGRSLLKHRQSKV